MRKRQPKHLDQLKFTEDAPPAEVIRRMRVTNYEAADFIDSEVLASLIRNRVQQSAGVVDEAVAVLNRRIQILVRKRLRNEWFDMQGRGSAVIEDTIYYVWESLLEVEGISNCEVYFLVFVHNRVDDYMRHLLTQKNSMESIDAMTVTDEDGNQTSFIDMVMDNGAETPEEVLQRVRQHEALYGMLMSLPKAERDAYYFRIVCEYEWNKVAAFIGCSVPTARQHLKRSMEKLLGVME